MSASASQRRLAALAGGGALLVALALLHLWRDLDYWNYAEGVYALTSRVLIDGDDLYGDVVVAQPPVMFVVGAALLVVEDSITWLRLGVGAIQAVTAALAGVAVWRLTGNAVAAAAAAPIALLTPWVVHEHGALTPELVGMPLLVGGALLAARPARAPAAGVLLSIAVFTKLPFLAPALLVALVAADRRRCAAWLAGAGFAQLLMWSAIFGPSMWDDIVLAQQGTGLHSLRQDAELGSQAVWNLLGLLVPAGAAVFLLPGRACDRALLNTCVALAAGLGVTLLTMAKEGTSLNTVGPVETALVILAVPGFLWLLQEARERGALVAVATIGAMLLAAQTVSVLAGPSDPRPFTRPDASGGLQRTLDTAQVRAEVTRAKACPPDVAFSGQPWLAFVAERRMPGDQPDTYLTTQSSRLDDVQAQIAEDQPLCPAP